MYKIEHFTISPSVHLSEEDKIFNPENDTIIIRTKEYYKHLVNTINTKYIHFNRPVIIFFESDKKLQDFLKSKPNIG
jgi:hypothetical protein